MTIQSSANFKFHVIQAESNQGSSKKAKREFVEAQSINKRELPIFSAAVQAGVVRPVAHRPN